MTEARGGLAPGDDGKLRCAWCASTPEYVRYHDEEWGFPSGDDARLFEKLCLEGFQSGLSWLTILRKREAFRRAFAGFDFWKVARFGARDVERLLGDAGIVRHRGKIESAIHNARLACDVAAEHGSFAAYVWSFEPGPASRPRRVTWAALRRMATTPASVAFAKDLRRRGFTFVGDHGVRVHAGGGARGRPPRRLRDPATRRAGAARLRAAARQGATLSAARPRPSRHALQVTARTCFVEPV